MDSFKTSEKIKVYVFRRPHLRADIRNWDGIDRNGVYAIWGPQKSKKRPPIYVGSGNVQTRLYAHHDNKSYWRNGEGIAIVSSGNRDLNQRQIQYLEHRLAQLIREAECWDLRTERTPRIRRISKANEDYLKDILVCLDGLSVNLLSKQPTQESNNFIQTRDDAPILRSSGKTLCLKSKGITAYGYEPPTGFVVLKGSQTVKQQARSCPSSISGIRKNLRQKGVLDTRYRFTQDHLFNSRSQASKVVLANSNDGSGWKSCQC